MDKATYVVESTIKLSKGPAQYCPKPDTSEPRIKKTRNAPKWQVYKWLERKACQGTKMDHKTVVSWVRPQTGAIFCLRENKTLAYYSNYEPCSIACKGDIGGRLPPIPNCYMGFRHLLDKLVLMNMTVHVRVVYIFHRMSICHRMLRMA